MQMQQCNPSGKIYPATSDYVHAMKINGLNSILFVSGTMGLRLDGVPGADIDEQLVLVWKNIKAILADAGMSINNVVRTTSYLRDPAYTHANQEARVKALNGRVVPTTTIVAQTLSAGWLVEIEVIACA